MKLESHTDLNQEVGIKQPSDTRWGSHFASLLNIQIIYASICDVLEDLGKFDSDRDRRVEAIHILKCLKSFDFMFCLHLMVDILGVTDHLNTILQRKDQDIVNAMNQRKLLCFVLQTKLKSWIWKMNILMDIVVYEVHRLELTDMPLQELNHRFNEVNNVSPSSTINIKHVVPFVLDLDQMNYDIWRELFEIHCIGYGVDDHLKLQPQSPPAKKEKDKATAESAEALTKGLRTDSIVKSWLYGTLSIPLLNMIFKKKATAFEVWENLEKVFRDNKASKIIQLDKDLQNISLGNLSITKNCNKIKSIADRLEHMDAKVFRS
uniref:Uncharacterized protein n=1 Tax=Lactuca sativa TaxID=4236 RepID=A0A9R1WUN9_LACSA|nr:hypothetical protein LSAT_V11C900493490 [Lactuca sativa]